MQFSTIIPSLFALASFLRGVTASPQPNLFPRQQSLSTASVFSSTVTTQCYTSRMTTQLSRAASTTSSTSYVSATSDKSTRITVTVTAAMKTRMVTSTATVTSMISTSTNGIATVTTTSTTLQTTTSSTTMTTTTTSTTTLTPTTISTSSGFQPVTSTLPTTSPAPAAAGPAASSKRSLPFLSHLNIFHPRQRGGSYLHHTWGHNRPRNYPGDVSCLTVLATGTVSIHTRTITSTYTPSPTTSTVTTTTIIVPKPTFMSATSTTTITTYTTNTMTFRQTRYATETDTSTSTPPGVMPTTYAACTVPANNVNRLTFGGSTANSNSQPVPLVNSDFSTYSGNSTSPYTCCVSAIMNPFGATWAWSPNYGCLVFVVQNTGGAAVTQCLAGQMGTSTRKEEVDVGQIGAANEFTVGNANCGAWNYIGSAS